MKASPNRRKFFEQLGIGTAGMVVGGYTATAKGFAKNETIQVGVIGSGGRVWRRLLPELVDIPGVQVTAVCDVWDEHIARAKEIAGNKVAATKDYRQLLARQDVDAVLIGSPDHWHVPMTVDACEAGKDVYVEKPLLHKLSEAEAVVGAQNGNRRMVQVGTQQRSMPQFIRARELVREGALGRIRKVRMTWNRNHTPYKKRDYDIAASSVDWQRWLGNAPGQAFDPFVMRNWRWFWNFGNGILTDLMVHWLDAVAFITRLDMPTDITAIGDNFSTKGIWQTPDTIQTLMRFPKQGMQLHFEGAFCNQHEQAMIEIMGEDATLYLDRKRLELTPEPRRKVKAETLDFAGEQSRKGGLGGEAEKLHLSNWLESIRSRKNPNSPAEAGDYAAQVALLANHAFREGRIVRP